MSPAGHFFLLGDNRAAVQEEKFGKTVHPQIAPLLAKHGFTEKRDQTAALTRLYNAGFAAAEWRDAITRQKRVGIRAPSGRPNAQWIET